MIIGHLLEGYNEHPFKMSTLNGNKFLEDRFSGVR